MKEKKNTPIKLIFLCVLFAIIVAVNSLQVINSSYLFIKVISLLGIIGLSVVTGAFIREIFNLKEKEKTQRQ